MPAAQSAQAPVAGERYCPAAQVVVGALGVEEGEVVAERVGLAGVEAEAVKVTVVQPLAVTVTVRVAVAVGVGEGELVAERVAVAVIVGEREVVAE